MVGEMYTAAGLFQKELGESPNRLQAGFDIFIEETYELLDEIRDNINGYLNREAFIKELADVQYTLSALAWEFGIDLDEAFRRVHESNMTKVVDGKVLRREDGKILKPDTYRAPDLSDL